MQNSTQTSDAASARTTSNITGQNLWDEILKAVFLTKPQQLFHLFKEVYGKEYPPGTTIQFISTEYSTFLDSPNTKPPSSQLMDFAVLVGGTDYYHIECQMENDKGMVIRMVAYDFHQKHLNFFLPYTLLRFRPLLKSKKQIDVKELTGFVEKIIVDLGEEVRNGILSQQEAEDLILLLTRASAHIFAKHPHYHEEVFHLTEPLIKLPSVRIDELEQESKQKDAIIAQKDNELSLKNLEIKHLQKLLADNGILC